MRRLTSDWTDRHLPVALALVVAVVGGAVAAAAPLPYSVVGVLLLAVTAVGALFLDALGGLVLGVVTAGGVVLSRRLGGSWTAGDFPESLALCLATVALGWLTGLASTAIRVPQDPRRDSAAPMPAYGSLGLMTAEPARARLDEEVVRARRHRRPLTVVVVGVTITDPSLDEATRTAARRTVARLVESEVRDSDVPFALDAHHVGAILPETDAAAAWDVVGPVLDAAARATFTVREYDERRRLVDCADLHAGLAGLSDRIPDADTLLEAARAAAQVDQASSRAPSHAAPETSA
jgi:hypothetical protein